MDYFVSSRHERFGYNAAIKDSLEQLKLPTTTADHFPDRKYEILGPVIGSLSSNTTGAFTKFKGTIGGDYDGQLEFIRIQAISRMISMAHMLGGDAIIGMRFDSVYNGIRYGNHCVYGTAVKFIEEKAQPPKADNLPDSQFDDTASRVSEWTNLSSTTAGP